MYPDVIVLNVEPKELGPVGYVHYYNLVSYLPMVFSCDKI